MFRFDLFRQDDMAALLNLVGEVTELGGIGSDEVMTAPPACDEFPVDVTALAGLMSTGRAVHGS